MSSIYVKQLPVPSQFKDQKGNDKKDKGKGDLAEEFEEFCDNCNNIKQQIKSESDLDKYMDHFKEKHFEEILEHFSIKSSHLTFVMKRSLMRATMKNEDIKTAVLISSKFLEIYRKSKHNQLAKIEDVETLTSLAIECNVKKDQKPIRLRKQLETHYVKHFSLKDILVALRENTALPIPEFEDNNPLKTCEKCGQNWGEKRFLVHISLSQECKVHYQEVFGEMKKEKRKEYYAEYYTR